MQIKEIYRAEKKISSWIRRTPMEFSPFLSELCRCKVWLKLENHQITGSFKIRGATNKILSLNLGESVKGIVTASSGNHGQGLSYIAKVLGVKAIIVVPRNTPKVKIKAIENYGVDLNVFGNEYIEAEMKAREIASSLDMTYVSPYNDLDIIAGQGTVGLEMLEEKPCLDTVLVPVGGGGLISGVGTVFKEFGKNRKVYGVQSYASPVMYESIKSGKIVDIEVLDSFAEGLHGGIEKNSVTFDYCKKLVDKFKLVEEDKILEAIKFCLINHRMLVEGAGAVGVAALINNPEEFYNRKVGLVISGGNIGQGLLKKVINN